MENGEMVAVCLDCYEQLTKQFRDEAKYGIPVDKRQYNWIQIPPPPLAAGDGNVPVSTSAAAVSGSDQQYIVHYSQKQQHQSTVRTTSHAHCYEDKRQRNPAIEHMPNISTSSGANILSSSGLTMTKASIASVSTSATTNIKVPLTSPPPPSHVVPTTATSSKPQAAAN